MDADRTLQNPDNSESELIVEVRQIVQAARNQSYRAINVMQIVSNWLIGQRIVVQEQMGKDKADYGKHVIEIVSAALTEEFGKGYSETNIKSMRKFYLIFSNLQIRQAMPAELKRLIYQKGQALPAELESTIPLFPQLSWTHYERLMRVKNETARLWYLNESAKQMWSYRTLDRNISTQYYERLLLSQKKEPVIAEMQEKTADFQKDRLAYIKNPIIAEFLGLQQQPSLHESTLEEAIINNLQQFLMELGKGFAFVARQQHLRTEENEQLYASKYKLYLPTEEELRREIERQKELYYLKQENK